MYTEMSPPLDIIEQEAEKYDRPFKIIKSERTLSPAPGQEVRTR
jgi:hypothetical protein